MGTEDSSEATNDSSSVVIHSEETSREPATNGNDTTNDNTITTNDDTTTTEAPSAGDDVPSAPTNGGGNVRTAEAVSVEGDDNAVADQDELVEQPSSKKIRLHEPETEPAAPAVPVAAEQPAKEETA